VCDGKILWGSAVEIEDGSHRFVAQVTVYARALGVALAQTTYDIAESSEWAALKELLSTLELEGVGEAPHPFRGNGSRETPWP
jgi:hypothetical protein